MSDPDALVAAFRRIGATRMAGMPLCNPALSVEAVAFRDWNAAQVGVLITPWSVNLVVLPGAALDPLGTGEQRVWQFPSGAYEFMGGAEPECGSFDFCSLFSPPDEFAGQDAARAVARAVMAQLFEGARPVSRRALFTPPAAAAAGG
jgi:[NiFe] hydrogenase assembly HybE family chaperone